MACLKPLHHISEYDITSRNQNCTAFWRQFDNIVWQTIFWNLPVLEILPQVVSWNQEQVGKSQILTEVAWLSIAESMTQYIVGGSSLILSQRKKDSLECEKAYECQLQKIHTDFHPFSSQCLGEGAREASICDFTVHFCWPWSLCWPLDWRCHEQLGAFILHHTRYKHWVSQL